MPLEVEICAAAADLTRQGVEEFHGYELAKGLSNGADRRMLTAYGTLYRALGRLEKMGLLQSRPEDPAIAARERRPGRRLYTLTLLGRTAVHDERRTVPTKPSRRPRRRLAPA